MMARFIRLFMPSLLLVGISVSVSAQCCAVGNPSMGIGSVGLVDKYKLRSITFFKAGWSDTYFEGSREALMQGKTANYNYMGQLLSFGLTNRIGADLELGYFFNKTENDEWLGTIRTSGPANAVVSVKALFWRKPDLWEFSGGVGVKFPVSSRVFYDEFGLPYPATLQPSFGALGTVGQIFLYRNFPGIGIKTMLISRYEDNGRDERGYLMGDAWLNSLFISKRIVGRHSGIVQFRNEWREYDFQDETRFATTGGNILFFTAQYACLLPGDWKVYAMADFPIYRYYNGVQLGTKVAAGLGVSKDFSFRAGP